MTMDARFKYTSLAAKHIAIEEGWDGDERQLELLIAALYQASLKCKPTRCPTAYAENSITVQRVKPCQKAKRDS